MGLISRVSSRTYRNSLFHFFHFFSYFQSTTQIQKMLFKRTFTKTIARRNLTNKPVFTYNPGRITIEPTKQLTLPGAFAMFTTIPMAAFNVLVLVGAREDSIVKI